MKTPGRSQRPGESEEFLKETFVTLHDEVLRWQDGLKFCAVYRHGIDIGNGPEKGKRPDVKHQKVGGVSASEARQSLIDKPETYGAIGLWSGPPTGICIYDIDRNLAGLQMLHPELETLPHITSTRPNAAKFVFMVKPEDREKLKGGDIPDGHGEILYGNHQGVIYGAYKDEGEYSIHGDFSKIPELPDWVYDQMLPKKQPKKAKGWTSFWNDVSRGRTDQQMLEILEQCLSVIPNTGIGGYDFWVMIGMACKSTGIEGALGKWREWSWRDEEYHEAGVWDHGADPCGEKWEQIDAEGGVTIGTIVQLAQEHDPENTRLPADLKRHLELKDKLQEFKVDGHEALIEAAKKAMEIDDPSKVQFTLHQLAIANGYRDSSAVANLLLAHEDYRAGASEMNAAELFDTDEQEPSEFLIPDLLAVPGFLLLSGRGGAGKTMTVLNLALHVLRGKPFIVKGREVPVKKGRVMWMNGDQNPKRLARQFREVGIDRHDDIVIMNGASMLWHSWFVRQMEKHRPRLVVWDSITSCMRGAAVDSNHQAYSDPAYWMSAKNGISFPGAAIVGLHHMNKRGEARGTTALEDSVDEAWTLRLPEGKEKERLGSSRILEIGKSREDNRGRVFYISRREDWSMEMKEDKDVSGGAIQSASDQLLGALRHRHVWMSSPEILALPVTGNDNVKRANLQRLVDKGLVERKGSRRKYQYRALLAPARARSEDSEGVRQAEIRSRGMEETNSRKYLDGSDKNEKSETQETLNGSPSDGFNNMLLARISDSPVTGTDLSDNSSSHRSHRKDPFSSEGVTD